MRVNRACRETEHAKAPTVGDLLVVHDIDDDLQSTIGGRSRIASNSAPALTSLPLREEGRLLSSAQPRAILSGWRTVSPNVLFTPTTVITGTFAFVGHHRCARTNARR